MLILTRNITAKNFEEKVLNNLLENVIKIARLGGAIIKNDYRKNIRIDFKGTGDLVTETDLKTEAAVTDEIKRLYPDHSIVCEEKTGDKQAEGDVVWYIDPVDGTTNFAHSFPFFSVSIGVEKAGEMVAACVYNPVQEELFYAHRGSGAYLNGEKINISSTEELETSLLVTGFAYNFRTTQGIESNFTHFVDFSHKAQAIRRTGSASLDLCYVACGRFDGFWELNLHSWDVAAGYLIVEEAGGRVTGFSGEKFSISSKKILATNTLIHKEMIQVLMNKGEK